MDKKYIIYAHQNKINGKIYIGQTSQKPETRQQNGAGYLNSTYFYKAIKKYGWHNFNHIILIENLTLEEANECEKFLIKKFKTNNSLYGYNLTLGGEGQLGRIMSQETKNKISKTKREAHMTGINNSRSKSVICLETKEIFESARQAALKYNLNDDAIAKCCRKERLTANNVHQMYQEDYSEEKAQEILNQKPKQKEIIKIRCKENGMIFNNLQEAATQCGLKSKSNISSCCTGKRQKAGKIPGSNTPCTQEYYFG